MGRQRTASGARRLAPACTDGKMHNLPPGTSTVPIVTLPSPPPFNEVSVNPDTLFAAIADPSNFEGSSELLLDSAGGRAIFVTERIDALGPKLGPDFVRFPAADVRPVNCYINRRAWVNFNRHPQIPNVIQIHGKNRLIPVKGTMEDVQKALG